MLDRSEQPNEAAGSDAWGNCPIFGRQGVTARTGLESSRAAYPGFRRRRPPWGLATVSRRTGRRHAACRWSIAAASNGLEALEAAQRPEPDAVILDLPTPEMNGVEAPPKFSACPSVAALASHHAR